MSAPLETFATLLDRSVEEIAAMAADARTFDTARIGKIANIWDNNTFPLVRAACSPALLRNWRARTGLLWMADLGATRRELMVELAAGLDATLPAAEAARSVFRDYDGRVFPGSFPATAETLASLATDYDLTNASVRSLAIQPTPTGLQAGLVLAAPRRFVPSTGYVARDGSHLPWPPAPLTFIFAAVTELRFDSHDRVGVAVTCTDGGITVAIGQGGGLAASSASLYPDDPRWYESAAGRAADSVAPHEPPLRRRHVGTSLLAGPPRRAAGALTGQMRRIRLASYYPELSAGIQVREICRVTEGAGSAIAEAGAYRRARRNEAFEQLVQRWGHVPSDAARAPIPTGQAMLRYVRYEEPHQDYGSPREGRAVVVAAVPEADPSAPWSLASELLSGPERFRLTASAFDGVTQTRRDGASLSIDDDLGIGGQ